MSTWREQERGGFAAGDRFMTRDGRDTGRIVELVSWNERVMKWWTRTEVHPRHPEMVGRHQHMRMSTLRQRYERISR